MTINTILKAVLLISDATMASTTTEVQLPSAVICELCLQPYEDPRILPCLHSFCRVCLEKETEHADVNLPLKCPSKGCKEHAALPRGVCGFPQNLRLRFDVEVAQHVVKVQGDAQNLCDSCEESGDPAVTYCSECREFLCQLCSAAHKRMKRTSKHDLMCFLDRNTFTSLKPKEFRCTEPKHEEEILKFYCETCQQLVCRDCILIKHKDHKHADLATVAKHQRQELKDILDPAQEANTALENALQESEEMIQLVQNRSKSVDNTIECVFDELKEALEAQRSSLLAKSKEVSMAKVTALTQQNEKFRLLQQKIVAYSETITELVQAYADEEVAALGGFLHAELDGSLTEFEDTPLKPIEGDSMPVLLDHTTLLEDIRDFGDVNNNCSPAHSTAELQTTQAIKNKERKIKVVSRKENLKPFCRGGEEVAAELRSLVYRDAPAVKGKTVDNGDGTYTVSVTPQIVGEHRLFITLRGQSIKGSPFTMVVREQSKTLAKYMAH